MGQQKHKNIKRALFLSILFGGQIIIGAGLAKFTGLFLFLLVVCGFAVAALATLEYVLYLLILFLPFSFRYIIGLNTEMQMPTEPLLAILIVALVVQKFAKSSRTPMREAIGVENRDQESVVLKSFFTFRNPKSEIRNPIRRFPFLIPIILYIFIILLSLVCSQHLYLSAKGALRAIAYILAAVLVFEIIDSPHRLKRFSFVSIISATIAVGWTLLFLIARRNILQWSSAFQGLLFTSYGNYGAFVAMFLLILLSRVLFDKKPYDHVIWVTLLVFYAFALCFSLSRGVWMSMAVTIPFLLFQRMEGAGHRKVILICAIVLLGLFMLSIPSLSHLIRGRVATFVDLGYASNRARLLRWGAALMMFLQNPILGKGYGAFAQAYRADPSLVGELSKYRMGTHNEYLQVLAETGILGFGVWMWLLVAFFVYGFRCLRRIEDSFYRSVIIGLMSAELSLAVYFLVNNLLAADKIGIPFWLIYGLLPAVGRMAEEQVKRNT